MDILQSDDESKKKEKPKLTRTGKVLLGVSAASFVTVFAVTTPFILPALRKFCLPYVPATTQQVDNVVRMLRASSGRLIDLGSGDGRIVVECAKRGFKAEGVELNPWLVWYSRWNAWRSGVGHLTHFYTQDMWKMNLSKYDHIVIFGVPCMMEPLETKLANELQPHGQVIACRFPMPTWRPVETVEQGIDTVWRYEKPSEETSVHSH
ncbi:ATP synthase subunit C lysine N-methyltransferase [Lamellibrachia satsuma]|nr:ATP synthase subunit C lysine N-methyltransferase [Lamellibrachia satsuma]